MKATHLMAYVVAMLLDSATDKSATAAESANRVRDEPQVIQLKDATRLKFLGLTHGNRHYPPGYETLPTVNWLYFGEDKTVAWIEAEHDPKTWPSFELLIFDKANTGCVHSEKQTSSRVKNGVDVLGFVLNAFPRWDKEMILRVKPYQAVIAEGQFVVTNREPPPAEHWTIESMPVTKSDGDFAVTLTNVMAGVPMPHGRGQPVPENTLANQGVRIALGFQQGGHSATDWIPRMVKTSDPFGNVIESAISDYPEGGVFEPPPNSSATDGYYYRRGLWPGPWPWKVRLEFTRTSGFKTDEILTFTNVPVRFGSQQDADDEWTWDQSKTNFTFITATASGVQVKLLEPLLYPAKILNDEMHLRVMLYTDPTPRVQDLRLTLMEATDEGGRPVSSPFSPAWAGHFDLDFPRSNEIKSLNLKLALHKSRYVDFTVKPSKQ